MQLPEALKGVLLAALWVCVAMMGYLGPGKLIAERTEGIDPSQIPLWPTLLFGLFLVITLVLTVAWAMTLRRRPR